MATEVLYFNERLDLRTEAAKRLIEDLRDRHKRHDGSYPLRCVEHGSPMYPKTINNELYVAHYPRRDGGSPCCANIRVGGESAEHLNAKEYWLRCAQNAGYATTPEHDPAGGRQRILDAYAEGHDGIRFGCEIQTSSITQTVVKTRQTKTYRRGNLGVMAYWWPFGAPKWINTVPTIRHPERMPFDELPAPNTVPAIGLHKIVIKPCRSYAFDRCPKTGRGQCDQWHPHYELIRGVTMDDAVAMVGAGQLIPHLNIYRRDVHVILADGLNGYTETTGHNGLYIPGGKRLAVSTPSSSRPCIADRPVETFTFCIMNPDHDLWAPVSQARGICERCWRDFGFHSNSVQLPFNLWSVN